MSLKNRTFSLILFGICLLLLGCSSKKKNGTSEYISDWEEIRKSGELTVVTLYSSTSYFMYKDEEMGYDYELALDFCRRNGLRLKIKVAENVNRLVELLNTGEADLIAYDLPILNTLKDSVLYCGINKISHQVLVQRSQKDSSLVKDVTDLIGKDVFVMFNTKHHQRINNLNKELGGGINIKNIKMDTITAEDMIALVASKNIDYTISDEYLAKLNRTYYSNIDVSLRISSDQRLSWAVRKTSPQLADALDKWYEENSDSPNYQKISKKYFEQSKKEFHSELELTKNLPIGHVSQYDNLFKNYAKGSGFDWQLLAAIGYQESRFRNHLTSWAGASGMMGIMPRTGESVGLAPADRANPELNVRASIKILKQLDGIFAAIEDREERTKFILAAYNGGMGHVMDGQRLAEKYGANPHLWEGNVKDFIKLKRFPEYYNDPVVKSGYFRGTETLRYVYDVTSNIKRFKQISQN